MSEGSNRMRTCVVGITVSPLLPWAAPLACTEFFKNDLPGGCGDVIREQIFIDRVADRYHRAYPNKHITDFISHDSYSKRLDRLRDCSVPSEYVEYTANNPYPVGIFFTDGIYSGLQSFFGVPYQNPNSNLEERLPGGIWDAFKCMSLGINPGVCEDLAKLPRCSLIKLPVDEYGP